MKNKLYVTNLADSAEQEALWTLFSQHGDVLGIEQGIDQRTQRRFAIVEFAAEKQATKANNSLNGHLLEGRRLAISTPELDLNREMTSKQRKAAEAIAEALGEKDEVPVREIHAIVQLCGTAFAAAIVEEAKQVFAEEGIPTSDGKRKRTLGGVFFYLARYRMAQPAYKIVFNRKGKMPLPAEEELLETEG